MRNRKERILYGLCIVISILVFISIFAPWLTYEGHTYSIGGFYSAVRASGGIDKFAAGNSGIYPLYIFLILPVTAGILSGVKALLLIFKGRKNALAYTVYGLEWVYMASFFAFGGYMPSLFACASPVLVLVEFLINRYLEDYKEITRKSRELREKEKREKAERQKRLYFPGKYSGYIYKMLLKSARYHKREYLLLLASGSFSVTFLFTVLAVENMMQGVHTSEVLLLGNGMQGILKEAVLTAIVINMVMMGFSFSHYARSKLTQERIMLRLGTRNSLLNKSRILEYGCCLVISLVTGCLFGNLVIFIFKQIIGKFSTVGVNSRLGFQVYIWTILIFVLVTVISLAVNYEIYLWEKYAETVQIKKEAVPGTRKIIAGLIAGTVLVSFSAICYQQRRFAESINYVYLFLTGAVFILTFLCAVWVRIKTSKRKNLRRKLERTSFIYRFRGSSRTLSIILAVHFLILTVYTMQFAGVLSAQPAESLYPYDFVCMAYPEDREIFNELKNEQVEVKQYPMVRVTSVEGDAYDWEDAASNRFMGVLWPQGQHVGISESTYIQLLKAQKKEAQKLNLTGEEVFIIYQQDTSFKAHPIDWYLFRKSPYLRVGQPLRSYLSEEREKLYPPRKVKGEKIEVLTGMFGRGMQENIVVFSDEYFQTLKAEGPTIWYLLNVKKDSVQPVRETLRKFEKKHREDSSWDEAIRPYYESMQVVKDTKAERLLKIVVSAFELLMLTACTLLILSLKFVSEYKDMQGRYQLLYRIGMCEKERKQTLRREIRPFFCIPLGVAFLLAALFTGITFRLRMYQPSQILNCLKYVVPVWGVYFLVQTVFYIVSKKTLYQVADEKEMGDD